MRQFNKILNIVYYSILAYTSILWILFYLKFQETEEIVYEVSRKQVGSIIIIIEVVYWLTTIIYYVWKWMTDKHGRRRLIRERKEKKVWKSKIRRRVEQA